MPKSCEVPHAAEDSKAAGDIAVTKKPASYRTEIIGGVPIITLTQVRILPNSTHLFDICFVFCIGSLKVIKNEVAHSSHCVFFHCVFCIVIINNVRTLHNVGMSCCDIGAGGEKWGECKICVG